MYFFSDIGGTCNTTSNGHVYADGGHYAPMMLRGALLPFQSDIRRKWPTSCYYRFIGTSNQRILLQLKYLRIGRYDLSTRRYLNNGCRIITSHYTSHYVTVNVWSFIVECGTIQLGRNYIAYTCDEYNVLLLPQRKLQKQ
jgi:hypothetical protein